MPVIKSIQAVSITIAANGTSNTATINSVVTANSAIFFGGIRGGDTTLNSSKDFANVVLTNSTTVTVTRNTADASNSLIVNATVIEFTAAAIKSVQVGSIAMAGVTSNTATITSVTTTNSVVIFNGITSTDVSTALSRSEINLSLTNGTTVTATKGTTLGTATVYFTVLEFNSSILNSSTQQGTCAISSGGTSATATITGITTAQTMLVYGGESNVSTTVESHIAWLTLTNTTTVTATRAAGGSDASNVNFSVLEFKAADIASVNRGSIVIATSNTANTATISAVNTALTIANYLGETNSAATSVLGNGTANLDLTNSTTLTATRASADASSTETVGYEAIEFKGSAFQPYFYRHVGGM